MIFTRMPYRIDSVYFEDNTLKIGCQCREYTPALTGGKAVFTDCRGRITVSLFSPANNIISVKITNHHSEPKAKPHGVVDLRPSAGSTVEDKNGFLCFKSGNLEARIQKNILGIKFYYYDMEIASQAPNIPVFYKTDSGSESCYIVSSNASTGASFNLKPGEMLYGLGRTGTSFIRNGQRISGKQDGPAAVNGHVPFVLSSSRYGLFVNTDRSITFDAGSESSRLSFEAEGETLEYVMIAGDSMTQILETYTQLNGRAPVLPYADGGIALSLNDDFTLTAQGIIDAVKEARSSGVDVSELWIGNSWHPDYAPYGMTWDTVRFPDPKAFARAMRDMGVTLGISVNPFVSERAPEYPELLDSNCFVSFPDGRAVLCDAEKGGVALLDLNIPGARSWLVNACNLLSSDGFNVFESNYTGNLSEAFEKASGKKGYLSGFNSILNTTLSEISAREHGRTGSFIISDSVGSGDQKAPFMNIFEPLAPDFTDLNAAVRNLISCNLTGFGGINIDIPGKDLTDPVLFERWVGFAAYAPHARFCGDLGFLKEAAVSGPVKSFSAIRNGIAPYIYSSLCEYINYGTPVVRAMGLEFAGDPASIFTDCEFMLGSSLLVAPVVAQNDSIRIYIPSGIWTDFMTHEKIQGPRYITRKVNNSALPVFVRPNSIIPTRTPDSNSNIASLDNLTFTCFGLSNGTTAACEVFGVGGQASGVITAETAGNRITVRTNNLGGNKRLILSGIFNVVGLSESVPEKLSYGTSIEFTSNELIISLG